MIANPAYFTPKDYLALEHNSNIRHEYRQGLVYAMVGGTDDHNRISLNLVTLLNGHFGDSRCQFFSGDVKVNYADDFFYYPDVFVTCDPRDREDRYIKRHPKLIAEVLSPSTAAFDRGLKFTDYQQLGSLEEYVLISQSVMQVECWRRVQGSWEKVVYGEGDEVCLVSLGLECGIELFYRGVSWRDGLS